MSLSIIIPAFNASAFIAETIESALRQTLLADDILVVDDGSTDGTAAVASSFPPPVRVVTTSNAKLGAARNFGISQVDTDWIAFLDADDLWDPRKLERQMEELSKDPEADVCYTGYVRFKMDGEIRVFRKATPAWPPEGLEQRLLESSVFLPSSVVVRRSTLMRVGCFSPDPGVAEDWDLWLRLLSFGAKFAACPEPLLLYRAHSNSITANEANTLKKNLRVYREHIVPQLSGTKKWFAAARYEGRYKGGASVDKAYQMREDGDPRCLNVMTLSILQWPFGDLTRYKVWLHMLLTRLRLLSVNDASQAE